MKNTQRTASQRSIFITASVKLTDRSSNAMRIYLQELNSDPLNKPLTHEEEMSMFREYTATEDKRVKDRIIRSNLKFVITVAKKYQVYELKFVNQKARIEDLVSEGNIGLVKAFDTFDPNAGNRFLTYAVWQIRQAITHYLNETLPDIPQPANRFIIDQWVKRATKALNGEGTEDPSIEQVVDKYNEIKDAKAPNLSINLLAKIRQDKKCFVSGSEPLMGEDNEGCIEDRFKSDHRTVPDYEIMDSSMKDTLDAILTKLLRPHEKEIVEHSYGINGKEEKTLDQIASLTGYTRERIGQILKQSIKKMETRKSVFASIF